VTHNDFKFVLFGAILLVAAVVVVVFGWCGCPVKVFAVGGLDARVVRVHCFDNLGIRRTTRNCVAWSDVL